MYLFTTTFLLASAFNANAGKSRETDLNFEGELYAIYLDPHFYFKGVGKQLFKACVNHLKTQNIHNMCLWVLEENIPACSFYKNMGGQAMAHIEKTLNIEGKKLKEILYVWNKL